MLKLELEWYDLTWGELRAFVNAVGDDAQDEDKVLIAQDWHGEDCGFEAYISPSGQGGAR